MSFNTIERSRQDGRPRELYEFQYGSAANMVYRYTNGENDVSFDGETYKAIPIYRESTRTDGKMDKSNLTIKVPVNTDLASLFLDWPPAQVVVVKIRAGHIEDPGNQYMIIFVGKVLSTSRGMFETTLTCESALIALKRPTMRRCWQFGCPHWLYGPDCRADKIAARKTVIVEDVEDNGTLKLPDGWYEPHTPSDYRGGLIDWQNPQLGLESRQIKKVTSTRMTILGIVRGIVPGDEVNIYLGCSHNQDDCEKLHDNILNYGGQPTIPTKNPIKQHPFW